MFSEVAVCEALADHISLLDFTSITCIIPVVIFKTVKWMCILLESSLTSLLGI